MGGKDIITRLVKTLPFTAGGTGSISGQGSKIWHTTWCSQKKWHHFINEENRLTVEVRIHSKTPLRDFVPPGILHGLTQSQLYYRSLQSGSQGPSLNLSTVLASSLAALFLCRPHVCSCIQSPEETYINRLRTRALPHSPIPCPVLTQCLPLWLFPKPSGPWPHKWSGVAKLIHEQKPRNKNIPCSGAWKLKVPDNYFSLTLK